MTQTAIVSVAGSEVAPAPMARVLDSRGAPVTNVSVTFELASGEGSVIGPPVTSNEMGVVRAGTWTLGTKVGTSVLRARLSATPSIAVDFTATTRAGSPALIVRLSGDAQRGVVGGALPESLSVKVVDRFDNPVAGTEVTFAVLTGGGTIGPSATTNGGGVASPGRWTLGAAATEQRVVASVAAARVEFSAIAYEPCVSPCRMDQSLAFVRDGDIHVSNADGTGVLKLTSGGRNENPAWSPDGRRIAFARNFPDPHTGGWGTSDIYIMNADGSNLARRTVGAQFRSAEWSPDGRTLAVSSEGHYYSEIHLLSVEDDGSPARLWAVAGRSPKWSPDGGRIAYQSTSGDDGYTQLLMSNVDGTSHRALTEVDHGGVYGLDWSPSGDRIAYVKCLVGCGLYVVNPDGSGTRQITYAGIAESIPFGDVAWSPDGLWIAFTLLQPGSHRLSIAYVPAEGGTARIVAVGGTDPAWRP